MSKDSSTPVMVISSIGNFAAILLGNRRSSSTEVQDRGSQRDSVSGLTQLGIGSFSLINVGAAEALPTPAIPLLT
jgi:hypothetical protein